VPFSVQGSVTINAASRCPGRQAEEYRTVGIQTLHQLSRSWRPITEQNTRPGHDDDLRLEWDGDVIVETDPGYADQPDYCPERIGPDEDGKCAIGA
jgi:hypothetical protein